MSTVAVCLVAACFVASLQTGHGSSVSDGRCAFMGSCFFDKNIDKSIPCVVDRPPTETFAPELWNEFADYCGDLAVTLSGDRRLCCDAHQFETLKKEMVSAEAIGMKRCPGCHKAFKNFMCQMTCSPKQANFVVVNATRNDHGSSGPAVQEVVYGVDQNFANALFNTCSMARSNLLVKLTTLMCGRYANRCTTIRFLRYLGSTDSEGGYSPFKIRYILLNDSNQDVRVTDYRGHETRLQRYTWKSYSSCTDG